MIPLLEKLAKVRDVRTCIPNFVERNHTYSFNHALHVCET